MTLEERAVLESGLEWEAEQQEKASEASQAGADDGPPRNNALNLQQMAALGAEVSEVP